MDDIETIGNLVEAGVWFVVAVVVAVKGMRSAGRMRRGLAVLAVTFFIFGISDLIESQTGAWWRPLWLMFLKGGCIVVIALGLGYCYTASRKGDDASG